MDIEDDAIIVATAHGAGAGRFLAASLADALGSGVPLVAVRDVPGATSGGQPGIEFVFAHPGSQYREVIRVGVQHDGHVISVQIMRLGQERCNTHHPAEHGLRSAVLASTSVSMLRWVDEPTVPCERALAVTVVAEHRLSMGDRSGESRQDAERATGRLSDEGQNASRVAGGQPQNATRSRPGTR